MAPDSIILYFAAGLRVGAEGADVLAVGSDGTPTAAAVAVGLGRMVVIGDSEFLWNGGPEFGLRAASNSRFFLGVIRHFLGPARRQRASKPASQVGPDSPTVLALIDDRRKTTLVETRTLVAALEKRGIRVLTGDDPSETTTVDALLSSIQ